MVRIKVFFVMKTQIVMHISESDSEIILHTIFLLNPCRRVKCCLASQIKSDKA